jgi:nicotinate-nucleotide pyrophosphorylase (carboxylating)
VRWRRRRRRPEPPRDVAGPSGQPQPDHQPAVVEGGTHDEDLPPPSTPLPRPPVRVVPHDGAGGAADADDDGPFSGLGPKGAPADDGDEEWAEAAYRARVEHAYPPESEERYEPPGRPGEASPQEPPPGAPRADEPTPAPDLPPPPEPLFADPASADPLPGAPVPDEAAAESAPGEPLPDETTPAAPASAGLAAPAPAREPADPSTPLPGDATVPADALEAAARAVVVRALDEDLDVGGDLTAEATIPPDTGGRARLIARADGVVAGLGLVALVYDHLDPRVEVHLTAADGDPVHHGDVVAEVSGPLRSVLTGERTALNLVTHLSGVATLTARYVEAVAGTGCVIRDTRKTTPGMRLLEKAAVRAGGGANHRLGLSDALLVKDNHVAAAGGVAEAARAALAGARGRHVQVEVDSPEQLEQAIDAGARDVLLDNFDPDETAGAVARVRELERTHGRILVESSGGLGLDTVRAFAEAGVDRLAIGALTHSAPQLDLALDLDPIDGTAHDATRDAAARGGAGS